MKYLGKITDAKDITNKEYVDNKVASAAGDGTGDMTKAVYDTTNNGNCDMADDVVLDAETVALWNEILGS